MTALVWLFTDFGPAGPYVGQLHGVLAREAPSVRVVDLMHDAPVHQPGLAGWLLAALASRFEPGDVVVGVVDPGVGTTSREPVAVHADGCWYVGPGNGLFDAVAARAAHARWFRLDWRPAHLSASFHGRDLFAPAAARLAVGGRPAMSPMAPPTAAHGPTLDRIVYVDAFGNAMTGMTADAARPGARLFARDQAFTHARTFGDVAPGDRLWYVNSAELIELAVNQGSAAAVAGLQPGDPVEWLD